MTATHLYPRQELAEHYLKLLVDRPQTALSLFGPRQIGKTTFITGDLSALASASAIHPIYVDLMAAADKLEAINGALREAAYALKTRRSQERVRGVKALGIGVDLDVAPTAPNSSDPGQQLQHLMADLLRQQGVKRILLLLDEVQELARSKDGDLTMKAVRAVANKYKADGRVMMLMTGSSKEDLSSLFAAHGRPSFGLAERQDFPVLGRDYVEYVVQRANEPRAKARKLKAEEFVEAFRMMDHRPADLEAFVGHVATYNITDVVGAVPSFLSARYPTDQLANRYAAMTPLQRILLNHIANGATELTGRAMMTTIMDQLGTSITPPAVRKALTSLPTDILSNPQRGTYVLVDPIFASWLKSTIK